jgi:hypothetical protein
MFIANSLDEIINICNTIDENTYVKMQESISINEAKVKKYHRLGDRLTDKLNELLG